MSEPASPLKITTSEDFGYWLQAQQLSLSFTTYQTNRLFCVGTTPAGRVAAHERLFDKPMGLYAAGDRLYMSTRYQLWQLDNLLAVGETRGSCDRLYLPKQAHTTGDLNVHDVVLNGSGQVIFVNTDFSCVAGLSSNYSFVPLWHPPFISRLVAEDRCHLNGLALVEGQPQYVTACGAIDTAAGWRDCRRDGGVAIDIQTNEIITTGLSMPHSPRWYQDKLWLLNSGTGELGAVDVASGQFMPLSFCPGFVRGLAFWHNFAFVGLSKLRSRPFTGLPLEERLSASGRTPQCGLLVIDVNTGQLCHWLHFEGVVEELFDVVVLPGVRQPQALGFQGEEIERLVTFPGSDGVVTTKPTVKRPSVGGDITPIAGLPQQIWKDPNLIVEVALAEDPVAAEVPLKFQRVFHLNAESLAPYDAFTYPSLQQRWQTQPQVGELVGISASVAGELIAFVIAEPLSDHVTSGRTAEIISLYVSPPYRQRGIGTRLVRYLEQALREDHYVQVSITFEPTILTALALEPLLSQLGWFQPVVARTGEQRSHKLLNPQSRPTISAAAQLSFRQGKQYSQQGDLSAAVKCFQEAIHHQPDYLAAYNQLGKTQQELGQLVAAISTYEQLLVLNPNVAQAHCNLGAIWQLQGEMERAIAAYQQAIQLKPDLMAAHLNLAKAQVRLEQWNQATRHYQNVVQLQPQHVEAHYSLGQIALDQGHFAQAQAAFQQVLSINPQHEQTLFAQGRLYEAQGHLEAALDCYQCLFDYHPHWQNIATYQLNYVRRQLCNWRNDDQQTSDLLQRVAFQVSHPDNLPLAPLSLSIFPASPKLHQAVNQHYAAHVERRVADLKARCTFVHLTGEIKKLRLGYVSPDFCHHPVGLLIQELLPHHNRDQFTIYAYALRYVADTVQTQVKAACDIFVDLSSLSTEAAAHRIYCDRIHILIDLAGYTTYSRPEIFALRPAPIQCSYLGYPDTSGAAFINYLFTDIWTVPSNLAVHYSEQVLYLPHQFAISSQFAAAADSPVLPHARENYSNLKIGYGLPADSFVFCCFNAHRKIDPSVFRIWMQILQQVPQAILWLSDGAELTKENLCNAAQHQGVDAQRLHFAPRLPFDQYLARYHCADLFLDTFAYSAGSTAVCALSAGVPLLTHPGETNASRMGASLCAAAGLDQLICDSATTYQQTAIYFATHPNELALIRQQLQSQRQKLPLFQPQQLIAHLESTCWQLWYQFNLD